MSKKTAAERFWPKVSIRSKDECWTWKGSLGTWGYGSFWLNGRNLNSQRAAWLIAKGEIPANTVVCHRCDNPPCCNPSHLFLGSQGDNVRDCNKKGRGKGLFSERFGADHPRFLSKLTPEKVIEARRLYAEGVSQSELGRRWGMSSSVISRAIRGLSWSHVK